jgi:hypothetical protein
MMSSAAASLHVVCSSPYCPKKWNTLKQMGGGWVTRA